MPVDSTGPGDAAQPSDEVESPAADERDASVELPETYAIARAVAFQGADGVLLPNVGHLAIALRIGGFRAPLVAMQHGDLLLAPALPGSQRRGRQIERRAAARLVDAEVAVSDFMKSEVLRA